MPKEPLLTVREVAHRVHRSEETVRRWIWSGKLRARKLGNQLFVEAAELARVQPGRRVSEAAVAYRPRGIERRGVARRTPVDRAIKQTAKYEYSSAVDIWQHRGQASKQEILRQIDEDEKFSDEMLAKYGFVDVASVFRELREEDD